MVTLAFYKGNSKNNGKLYSKLIRWWTKGPYSHVEIILDGYMYSSSPRDGGVRRKKFKGKNDHWDFIEINNLKEKNILEFYNQTKENKYDFFGILGFILPFKDRTNEWFCSEWCSNALKISGYKKLWKLEPSKISPNKLYKIVTED